MGGCLCLVDLVFPHELVGTDDSNRETESTEDFLDEIEQIYPFCAAKHILYKSSCYGARIVGTSVRNFPVGTFPYIPSCLDVRSMIRI